VRQAKNPTTLLAGHDGLPDPAPRGTPCLPPQCALAPTRSRAGGGGQGGGGQGCGGQGGGGLEIVESEGVPAELAAGDSSLGFRGSQTIESNLAELLW
jgi:hypothetical protein